MYTQQVQRTHLSLWYAEICNRHSNCTEQVRHKYLTTLQSNLSWCIPKWSKIIH